MPCTEFQARQALALFGGKAVVRQLDVLCGQLCILLNSDDEEAVHQSRVASRRLRACLDVFGPALGATSEWHAEARKVTKALGDARDLDVQIGRLRRYLEGDDKELAPLLEEMQLLRAEMYKDVRRSASRFLESRAARRMSSCAEPGEAQPSMRARVHILRRLDELLELQSCLEDEKRVEEHHAMRIAAKRLRYTMEIFRPLYGEWFSEVLQAVKGMQEALGEVHDRDVWIEELGRKREGSGFQDLMLQERMEWFAKANAQWKELTVMEMPEKLRSLTVTEERMPQLGLIALISDVHGNLPALRAVLRDAAREGADRAVCAGDVVGLGPYPDEVIEVLRAAGISCVKGNFDEAAADYMLRQKGGWQDHAALMSVQGIEKRDLQWLDALPTSLNADGMAVYHAAPWSLREKVPPDADGALLDRVAREGGADIVVLGHTHQQMAIYHRGVQIVNPGSVGRQGEGDARARYALLDGQGGIRLRVVTYPAGETADECDACGFPPAVGDTFRLGIPLEHALREREREQTRGEEERMKALVSACREHAKNIGGGAEHEEKVRGLAVLLFDAVQDKKLGQNERGLLECAALLHDLGLNEGLKGHHKTSMRMIMGSDLPFEEGEKRMVAVVARYHRKAEPKAGHEHYSDLEKDERAVARRLAALLRAADGLDHTGGSGWTAEDKGTEIVIRSSTPLAFPLAEDKVSMFRSEFSKELRLG